MLNHWRVQSRQRPGSSSYNVMLAVEVVVHRVLGDWRVMKRKMEGGVADERYGSTMMTVHDCDLNVVCSVATGALVECMRTRRKVESCGKSARQARARRVYWEWRGDGDVVVVVVAHARVHALLLGARRTRHDGDDGDGGAGGGGGVEDP